MLNVFFSSLPERPVESNLSRLQTADSRPLSGPAKSFSIALPPGIAAHVVTALFPVTRLVLCQKAHAFDPLRRLPGVKLRHDQTHWPAVLRRYWLAVMRPGEQ